MYMVEKKLKKKATVIKKTKPIAKEAKDRRRRRRKKRSKNSHQCFYKVKGRYMTPRQAARARRKRRFGKPG